MNKNLKHVVPKEVWRKQVKIELIRSNRKTISIEIKKENVILVRAPYSMTDAAIEKFLSEKEEWILTHLQKAIENAERVREIERLSEEEIYKLADLALEIIPVKVKHYADIMKVRYGRITIRNQKTRWGSCSGKGNLNFNCLLMLAPDEVVDYVVVHELCHLLEMNHSKAFWEHVEQVIPDYKRQRKWLKEHGEELMSRMYPCAG